MGYFDALTSGSFKTTPDGRRLFFPWGALGRGYALPTEQDYERLHGQVKTYVIVSLVVIIGSVILLSPLWAFVVAAVVIAFYLAWLPLLTRGLARSDEKLTVTESMSTQARTHSAWMLWLLLVFALVFVAGGIVMLAVDPRDWLLAVFSIVFFGACAVVFIRMLALRRRAGGGQT